jgi:hypothetical protein
MSEPHFTATVAQGIFRLLGVAPSVYAKLKQWRGGPSKMDARSHGAPLAMRSESARLCRAPELDNGQVRAPLELSQRKLEPPAQAAPQPAGSRSRHERKVKPLVALAAVSCLGCSFVFVTGPPSEPPSDPREPVPECTTSKLVPVLDGAAATLAAISMVVVATADRGEETVYGIEMEPEAALGVTAAQLAAFGAGSVYGFVQTSRCTSYHEERERAQRPTWSPALTPKSPPPSPPARR